MTFLRVLFLPVSVAILLASASIVPLPLFVELPTAPVSLTEAVELPDQPATVNGDYLLTAVNVARATVFRLGRAAVDDGADLVPVTALIPRGVDDRTYFSRQREVFRISAEIAAAVGLRAAGLPADPSQITGEGARVEQVVAGSPAEGTLQLGDVIVGVGGMAISTEADLRQAVASLVEGVGGDQPTPLGITLLRDGETVEVEVTPIEEPGTGRPIIGILPATHNPRVPLPVEVEIDAGRIGGPSAGLMIALTVYDQVETEVDLAAGRRIAGTGALDADGSVRPIGGIRQKVLASHAEGIDVFLAPAEQIDEARAAVPAGSAMQVLPVATFDDARAALAGA